VVRGKRAVFGEERVVCSGVCEVSASLGTTTRRIQGSAFKVVLICNISHSHLSGCTEHSSVPAAVSSYEVCRPPVPSQLPCSSSPLSDS
jgi:hypothetical protein